MFIFLCNLSRIFVLFELERHFCLANKYAKSLNLPSSFYHRFVQVTIEKLNK